MSRVLFIATHPDDETLGCGGTILRHKDRGDEIFWLIVTNISESQGYSSKQVSDRQKEIAAVADIYGFNEVFKLDFPTTKLDTVGMTDLIGGISEVIANVKADIIYLPNRSDVHTDHQIVFKAAESCSKNFRYPFIKRILMYETLSETEFSLVSKDAFSPNVFIDISDHLQTKLKAMRIYKTEVMESPLPRSIEVIESLAKLRGSRIGKEYAESFVLLYEEMA